MPIAAGIPRFPVPDGAATSESVFDRLAPVYESPAWFRPLYRFVGGPAAPRDDRAAVAALLELDEGGRAEAADAPAALDVACGTGRFTRYVAEGADPAVGVDVSAGMLERASRYATADGIETVAFARMSADRLWFEDDRFDRVACCWALHLFPDVDAALEEIHRVLRPGGRFAGSVIVDEYVLGVPAVRLGARVAVGAEPFAVEGFRASLREAGFSGLSIDRRGGVAFFGARRE